MCMFPTVEDCCMGIPLRIGMLLMSVLAIMTGSISLDLIEQNSDLLHYAIPIPAEYKAYATSNEMRYAFSVYRAHQPRYLTPEQNFSLSRSKLYLMLCILSALCFMCIFCMLMGLVLLIGTLMGEQCLVYVFVAGMFLLVMLGFLLAVAVSYECLLDQNEFVGHNCLFEEDACLMRNFDWLTGGICMVLYIVYLFVWMYFIIVANSYAVNGDT